VPGDVIVAVDNMAVRTMADLRARLYVLLPGTSIALSVQGASGATTTVDVTLSASP
jgi:S1-C subfamily serine protease